jgi:uncharacterized Zn finger protein (UPF0148 family)
VQQVVSSFDARDKQALARSDAQLALSYPGITKWLRKPVFVLSLAVGCGYLLFAAFMVASSPRAMMPALLVTLPMLATVWMVYGSRSSAQARRARFRLTACRLLEGHCAVCDYALPQASAKTGNHTLCAECGALWDVPAWHASFVTPVAMLAAHEPLQTKYRVAEAAVFGKPTDPKQAKVLAKATWQQAKEYVPREAWRYIRGPSLLVVFLALVTLATPLLWPIVVVNATSVREAILMRVLTVGLPLFLTTLLVWFHARECSIAVIHAHRRGNNHCEHCETPLTMQRCHADRTIVCESCGARRSLDIPLP